MPRPSPVPGASVGNPVVPPDAATLEAPEADSRPWEQVRSELGLKAADVARHRTRLEADADACRLAEIRKHRRVTQQDLAETLGVSQSRVSQIERQSIDDTVVSTLAAYVEALGASILILADFGEEQFVLRRATGPSISNETGTAARMSRPDL
jgi:DNA-binding XRE family transcriptional regulator